MNKNHNLEKCKAIFVASVVSLFCAVGAGVAADTTLHDVVTDVSEITFAAASPNGTTKISGATLWSDAETDRLSLMLKFTKGTTNKHFHAFDEHVTLVKGTAIHRAEKCQKPTPSSSKRVAIGMCPLAVCIRTPV